MQISFIYPNDSASELIDAVEDLNIGISNQNLSSFPVRFLGLLARLALFVIYFIVSWFVFKHVTYSITAKGTETIIMSLFIFLLVYISGIFGIYRLGIYVRKLILSLMKTDEAEESYSFSEYVTRKDPLKKRQKSLRLYQMCDTLKQSQILDATARSDGDYCRIEVSWQSDSDKSVYVFKFPYKTSASNDEIIVDFERELVLLPYLKDMEERSNDEN